MPLRAKNTQKKFHRGVICRNLTGLEIQNFKVFQSLITRFFGPKIPTAVSGNMEFSGFSVH